MECGSMVGTVVTILVFPDVTPPGCGGAQTTTSGDPTLPKEGAAYDAHRLASKHAATASALSIGGRKGASGRLTAGT